MFSLNMVQRNEQRAKITLKGQHGMTIYFIYITPNHNNSYLNELYIVSLRPYNNTDKTTRIR